MTTPALESIRTRLRAAERSVREQRPALLDAVRTDSDFQKENVTLYDFDTLGNIDMIIDLLDDRAAACLDRMPNRTMIDIGCANGELGFAFEEAGFSVALLDRSHVAEKEGGHVRQNAPLVASIMARNKGSRAVIFDEDVDNGFDPRRIVDGFASSRSNSSFDRFGLGVMLGVLYHLKNPYSAVEKLGQLCDYLILGTWVTDCLPKRQTIIRDEQVVFLLKDRQLAADPTNYWIFTPQSFRVLVERCGWQILAEHSVTNPVPEVPKGRVRRRLEHWVHLPAAQRGVSPADDVKQRIIVLLKRRDLDASH